MFKVLMVCTGNICRSVMAEQVLREALEAEPDLADKVSVDSCGISDEEFGNPPDRRAARVLRENNYDVPDHRARKIMDSDFEEFDLILAMTTGHLRSVDRLAERLGIDVAAGFAKADPNTPNPTDEDIEGKPIPDIRMYRDFDPTVIESDRQDFRPGGHERVPGRKRSNWSMATIYGHGSPMDVPDPWYGDYSDFVQTLEVIERVTPEIVKHIHSQLDS